MEQRIVSVFLIFFAVEFLVEFLLNELNLRHVRARRADKQIPDYFRGKLSPDEYENRSNTRSPKVASSAGAGIYGRIMTLAILFGGLLGR